MRENFTYTEEEKILMARTIWAEARGEGLRGMQAVAHVMTNRAIIGGRFGEDLEDVLTKSGIDRDTGKRVWQFSCHNPDDSNYDAMMSVTEDDPQFAAALHIADGVLSGRYYDITEGADHYHANYVSPDWEDNAKQTATVGQHEFYNFSGVDARLYLTPGRLRAEGTTRAEYLQVPTPLPEASLRSNSHRVLFANISHNTSHAPYIGAVETLREPEPVSLEALFQDNLETIIAGEDQTFDDLLQERADEIGITEENFDEFRQTVIELNGEAFDPDNLQEGQEFLLPDFQADASDKDDALDSLRNHYGIHAPNSGPDSLSETTFKSTRPAAEPVIATP